MEAKLKVGIVDSDRMSLAYKNTLLNLEDKFVVVGFYNVHTSFNHEANEPVRSFDDFSEFLSAVDVVLFFGDDSFNYIIQSLRRIKPVFINNINSLPIEEIKVIGRISEEAGVSVVYSPYEDTNDDFTIVSHQLSGIKINQLEFDYRMKKNGLSNADFENWIFPKILLAIHLVNSSIKTIDVENFNQSIGRNLRIRIKFDNQTKVYFRFCELAPRAGEEIIALCEKNRWNFDLFHQTSIKLQCANNELVIEESKWEKLAKEERVEKNLLEFYQLVQRQCKQSLTLDDCWRAMFVMMKMKAENKSFLQVDAN